MLSGAVQVMISKPILALRGHQRETGANAAVLWSLCSSPALLALWDHFWFGLRNDVMLYSRQLLMRGLLYFPQQSAVS